MAKIETIEGIGPAYQEKLAGAGITTVEGLLKKGTSSQEREAIAEATGISAKLIHKWSSMADLFRIKGIAGEFAELLVAAGVTSVGDLADQDADELRATLESVNEEKKLTRNIPSAKSLGGFIDEASSLDAMLED